VYSEVCWSAGHAFGVDGAWGILLIGHLMQVIQEVHAQRCYVEFRTLVVLTGIKQVGWATR